jgi:hypothetical protein
MRKIKSLMHTILMVCTIVLLSVCTFAQTATPPSVGDGSESNPYQIATLENLYWLTQSDTVWDKHFIQIADIDASSSSGWDNDSGFNPIGNRTIPFMGNYNGKEYVIDRIYINRPEDGDIGLFGYMASNAHIDSLGLIDINILGEINVGGLVGWIQGGEAVSCYATGVCRNNAGYYWAARNGGLVGTNWHGNIEYCYSDVEVSCIESFWGGDDIVGGLVGWNKGFILSSYSTGNVTADRYVGGLVGENEGLITNSYSKGHVIGSLGNVGGLVGYNNGGSSVSCFWDTESSGQAQSDGGTGLTTKEMKELEPYLNSGWDFMDETYNGINDYWGMNSWENGGYPFLQWQGYTNTVTECQAPFSPADSIILEDNFGNSVVVRSFTKGGYGAVGYAVCVNAEDTWIVPEDGTEPTADQDWQNNGQQCIFFGTSNKPDVTVTGLLEETKYYFKVFAYNDCSGTEIYEHIGTEANITTKVSNLIPEGEGSKINPYTITNLENLAWLMYNNTEWDKHYIQTANIDASRTNIWDNESGFTPIGNSTTPFTGTYDGKENYIDYLNINRPGDSLIGLFGKIHTNARIENLELINIDIKGGRYVGGIVGFNYEGKIINSYSAGTCIGSKSDKQWGAAGGLVGYNIGTITCCYSDVNVSSTDDIVGGAAGVNEGYIFGSYSTGDISGNNYVGGFLGVNFGTIVNCYSRSGVRSNTNNCGGLIGDSYGGYALSCFWDTETSDQNTSYGGEGLTTAKMKDINTYINVRWDFMDETSNGTDDFWGLNSNENSGYPFLYWQGYTNTTTLPTYLINLEEKGVIIYPNPVRSILNIELKDDCNKRIIISDITGKIIVEKVVASEKEYFDMSTFNSGVYLITIYKDMDEIYSGKIIKK